MKLWQKEGAVALERIHDFTVGRDREFDLQLAEYDIQGSLAHIAMLAKVGLLRQEEYELLQNELNHLKDEVLNGTFTIDEQAEDIHSQIELILTERLGDTGKKIHSGRSRNDQIATDLKLYQRAQVLKIKEAVNALFQLFIELSETHKEHLLPGYTHLQIAMPSSFGLWFGAYAESLVDDMQLLAAAYDMCNKNPLGSGAGYGSSLPLDRALTTELLQFKQMHYNSIYAQMSRGKTERFVAMAISSIAATMARFSMDVCLYLSQNFSFISFPDQLTTGSSIMPHKKNPDVFELIRAKCNRIQAVPNELALLMTNLPSGYHRDMQLTKEILFPAIIELLDCLDTLYFMLRHISVKENILEEERYAYLFSVEKVNALVNAGTPFREAYTIVGKEIADGQFNYRDKLHHTHQGSIGNLCNDAIGAAMQEVMKRF
jgi:argininosuccinate lyase